jgi:hypothetical protein
MELIEKAKEIDNLWDEDSYYYQVGVNYILECGDADMAIDDTLDSCRLHWVEGEGYKRWTPHKLNQLARDYILNMNTYEREGADRCTEAFWGCSLKDAITLLGRGEADAKV